MKLYNLQIIILVIWGGLFISCEKIVDNVKTPEYTPKLVLHAFISPSDSVINVHVASTTNIFGKTDFNESLSSVIVTLNDGVSLYPFSRRNDTTCICSLKYKVQAGKKYEIVAHCPGYPDATGVCTIPNIENIDISMDTTSNFIILGNG